jgi:hypothetical protein
VIRELQASIGGRSIWRMTWLKQLTMESLLHGEVTGVGSAGHLRVPPNVAFGCAELPNPTTPREHLVAGRPLITTIYSHIPHIRNVGRGFCSMGAG